MGIFSKLDYRDGRISLEASPGIEAIAVQKNDWFVNNLFKNVKYIKDSINSKADSIDISKFVLDIESDIEKRFGIPCRININSVPMACGLHGYDNDGGLMACAEFLRSVEAFGIKSKMAQTAKENIVKLDVWAKSNKIVIDDQKAYISNLPKDFQASFYINFKEIFTGKAWTIGSDNLTVEEICAMILHEIGHAYTMISYSYKTRASRIVFEDVMKDQVRKGSEPKKAIIMAYKEAFDKRLDEKEFKNVSFYTTATICTKKLFDRYKYDGSRRSSTDAEFAADQFAARFGLGMELTTALKKVSYDAKTASRFRILNITFRELILLILFFITIFNQFGAAGSTLGAFFATLLCTIAVIGFFYLVISVVEQLMIANKGLPYDTELRRLERVRNEYVRQIRIYGGNDTKFISGIIEDIDAMEAMVKLYKESGMNATNVVKSKIIEFFSSDYTNARMLEEFDNSIEDLMENPLYVEANRF